MSGFNKYIIGTTLLFALLANVLEGTPSGPFNKEPGLDEDFIMLDGVKYKKPREDHPMCNSRVDMVVIVRWPLGLDKDEWIDKIKEYLPKFISKLEIGKDRFRVGLITSHPKNEYLVHLDKDESYDKDKILEIAKRDIDVKTFFTGFSIDEMLDVAYTMFKQAEPRNAVKYVYLISDGTLLDEAKVTKSLNRLRSVPIEVYVQGIGPTSQLWLKPTMGCDIDNKNPCPNFMLSNPGDDLDPEKAYTRICLGLPQNAVCELHYGPFSECNKPCGPMEMKHALLTSYTVRRKATLGIVGFNPGTSCQKQAANKDIIFKKCTPRECGTETPRRGASVEDRLSLVHDKLQKLNAGRKSTATTPKRRTGHSGLNNSLRKVVTATKWKKRTAKSPHAHSNKKSLSNVSSTKLAAIRALANNPMLKQAAEDEVHPEELEELQQPPVLSNEKSNDTEEQEATLKSDQPQNTEQEGDEGGDKEKENAEPQSENDKKEEIEEAKETKPAEKEPADNTATTSSESEKQVPEVPPEQKEELPLEKQEELPQSSPTPSEDLEEEEEEEATELPTEEEIGHTTVTTVHHDKPIEEHDFHHTYESAEGLGPEELEELEEEYNDNIYAEPYQHDDQYEYDEEEELPEEEGDEYVDEEHEHGGDEELHEHEEQDVDDYHSYAEPYQSAEVYESYEDPYESIAHGSVEDEHEEDTSGEEPEEEEEYEMGTNDLDRREEDEDEEEQVNETSNNRKNIANKANTPLTPNNAKVKKVANNNEHEDEDHHENLNSEKHDEDSLFGDLLDSNMTQNVKIAGGVVGAIIVLGIAGLAFARKRKGLKGSGYDGIVYNEGDDDFGYAENSENYTVTGVDDTLWGE